MLRRSRHRLPTLLMTFSALSCIFVVAPHARAVTVEVQVDNFVFRPARVNIRAGDTVRWIWVKGPHSVISGQSCTPDGRWSSGIKSAGSYEQTFAQPGQYPYFCDPHCPSMTGTVMVSTTNPSPSSAGHPHHGTS
jgi:plastocyanin